MTDEIDGVDWEEVAGDRPSLDGWRRRAVGVDEDVALEQLPEAAVLRAWVRIGPYRRLQQHVHSRGMTLSQWVRDACADMALAEGLEPDVAKRLRDGGHP